MFSENETGQNDSLKEYYQEIADGMAPPPTLVKAAKNGVYLSPAQNRGHIRRFAKAAASYALGIVLLLGAIVLLPKIWEDGEATSSQTAAPSEPTTEPDIVLSSLYDRETVTEIGFMNERVSETRFFTSDFEMIDALYQELGQIRVTTSDTDAIYSTCGAAAYEICIAFENGDWALCGFVRDSNEVCYLVYNAKLAIQSAQHFLISDADRARLENYVYKQAELLSQFVEIPSPEEYLDGEVTEGALDYDYYNGENVHCDGNRILDAAQITAIVAQLKTTLTGVPLFTQSLELGDQNYEVQNFKQYTVNLNFKNNKEVWLDLYPNTGLIRVYTIAEGEIPNTYYFRIPAVNAQELAFWLKGYYNGESVSEFPTLEYYLSQEMYPRFNLFDSVDSVPFVEVTERNAVEEFYQYVRDLNFTLVSDEIPSQDPAPDGRKIEFLLSHNAERLILELDSSGKINCQLLDGYWKTPLFAAQYSLSADDYAELVAYIDALKNADTQN